MHQQREGLIAAIAALLVLFSAMFEPWLSLTLAAVFLVVLGIYHYRGRQ